METAATRTCCWWLDEAYLFLQSTYPDTLWIRERKPRDTVLRAQIGLGVCPFASPSISLICSRFCWWLKHIQVKTKQNSSSSGASRDPEVRRCAVQSEHALEGLALWAAAHETPSETPSSSYRQRPVPPPLRWRESLPSQRTFFRVKWNSQC